MVNHIIDQTPKKYVTDYESNMSKTLNSSYAMSCKLYININNVRKYCVSENKNMLCNIVWNN